jgi:hypothetical protein
MRHALIATLALCAFAAQAIPQATAKRKIPCKTPENAASCYWTRGRLSLANGSPPWRIWKVGTRRMLAIHSGPATWPPRDQRGSLDPSFPANLESVYRTRVTDPSLNRVFADFEICPLEPEREGVMQHVCIESAKNIFVQRQSLPQ